MVRSMKDLKTLLGNYDGVENDLKFASISDEIWRLGSLEGIKKEVSPEAFTFHIAVSMIGNWKCDGWGCIFAEGHWLLPYVSGTLNELGLKELNNQFDDTVFWVKGIFCKCWGGVS